MLTLWKKSYDTHVDCVLKSRDITLPTKIHIVKAMVFHMACSLPDSFVRGIFQARILECVASSHVRMWELDHKEDRAQKNRCFWIVLLKKTLVSPWTARRSNLSVLKEIKPEYSLKGLMLKPQYFGHLVPLLTHCRLIGKDPDAGKNWGQIEKWVTEDETIEWHHWHNGHEFVHAREAWLAAVHGLTKSRTQLINQTIVCLQYNISFRCIT